MNDHLSDYTEDERRLFRNLPRTALPDPAVEESVVARLREERLLRSRAARLKRAARFALAAGLIAAAWIGGANYGARSARGGSIEGMLARTDLSATERILLMQRAGSAYVAAANGYASSVKNADAAAMEVSSQVLIGAAQAVARTQLNGSLAARIAGLVREAPSAPKIQPVIWY